MGSDSDESDDAVETSARINIGKFRRDDNVHGDGLDSSPEPDAKYERQLSSARKKRSLSNSDSDQEQKQKKPKQTVVSRENFRLI